MGSQYIQDNNDFIDLKMMQSKKLIKMSNDELIKLIQKYSQLVESFDGEQQSYEDKILKQQKKIQSLEKTVEANVSRLKIFQKDFQDLQNGVNCPNCRMYKLKSKKQKEVFEIALQKMDQQIKSIQKCAFQQQQFKFSQQLANLNDAQTDKQLIEIYSENNQKIQQALEKTQQILIKTQQINEQQLMELEQCNIQMEKKDKHIQKLSQDFQQIRSKFDDEIKKFKIVLNSSIETSNGEKQKLLTKIEKLDQIYQLVKDENSQLKQRISQLNQVIEQNSSQIQHQMKNFEQTIAQNNMLIQENDQLTKNIQGLEKNIKQILDNQKDNENQKNLSKSKEWKGPLRQEKENQQVKEPDPSYLKLLNLSKIILKFPTVVENIREFK